MLYLGGKGRVGREIASVILAAVSDRRLYLEPFIGGGSAFKHLAQHFENVSAGDTHQDLMLMYEAVAEGWDPPRVVSEDEYRSAKKATSSPTRGFIGFGCSFGGKWWGGYARSKQNGDGYYARHAAKSLTDIRPDLARATLRTCSYDEWALTPGTVIYCDIPYFGTTRYKDAFDHDRFWRWAERASKQGCYVFVSEYTAPPGWREVWSKEQRRKVSGGTGANTRERLFTAFETPPAAEPAQP